MKYKFLEETPLYKCSDNNKIEFGHKEIISTLKDIVKKSCSPFTIGLFGNWGSGKSTIAENLKQELINEKIPTVIFDVWKHEGDSLRRSFLLELEKQLKSKELIKFFNRKFNLNKRVESQINKEKETLKIEIKKALLTGLVILITAIPLIFFAFIFWLIFVNWLGIIDLPSFGILSILIPTVAFIIKYVQKFIKSEKTIEHYDKFQDPHEFEGEFNNVISNLKVKRILIVFDNLDRVSGENAIKIISTIKTFLEPVDIKNLNKEVVFLIPCDVTAIKNHLNKVFKNNSSLDNSNYADEFLRKFFNTIIWIPDFYSTELESFARKKLQETLIKDLDNDRLSSLVTRVFSQNPRQIIQFINILISNYLLIYEREKTNKELETGFLKNNIAQLAKYLLLVQKFPLIINTLKKHNVFTLRDINYNIIHKFNPDIEQEYFDDFDYFLRSTSDTHLESLEIFFRLRKSPYEQRIEGISRLLKLIIDDQIFTDKEYLNSLDLKNNVADFNFIIIQYLNDNNGYTTKCRFINGLFKLTKHLEIQLSERCFDEIDISLKESITQLDKIEPELLVEEFLSKYGKIRVTTRKDIIKQWIEILKEYSTKSTAKYNVSADYAESVLKSLFKIEGILSKKDKLDIKTILPNLIQIDSIISLIANSHDLQEHFLSSKYLFSVISTITEVDFENESPNEKIILLTKIKPDLIDIENAGNLIGKMNELINIENNKPIDNRIEIKKNLISFCSKTFNNFSVKINKYDNNQLKQTLVNSVINGYNSLRWSNCYIYIPLFLEFEKSNTEPFLSNAKNILNGFMTQVHQISMEGIEFIFDFVSDKYDFINRPDFKNNIIEATYNSDSHLEKFYPLANNELKIEILRKMVQTRQIDKLERFLSSINYQSPNNNLLVDSILNQLKKNFEFDKKKQFFNMIEILKPSKEEINFENYKNIIVTFLQNVEQEEYGASIFNNSIYLDNASKVEIAGDCLNWMTSTNNYFLLKTKEAISNVFTFFDEARKNQFLSLIIDRYIIGSNNKVYINSVKEKIRHMQNSNNPLKPNYVVGFKNLAIKARGFKEEKTELLDWLKDYE